MLGGKTILAMVCAMMFASAFADTQTVDGVTWTYTISNGEATVGGGTASSKAVPKDTAGSISIPEILGGCPVVGIGNDAFNGCSMITSVDMPASVATLGNYAFANCTSLVSVELKEGLTSIGDSAFRYCDKLVAVAIPTSVTTLGGWAFASCTSLISVELSEGLKSIGGDAFYGCSKLGMMTVPGSVTSLGDSAFYGASFTNVVLSEGVASLSQWAFWHCSKLKSLTIPSSLKTISSQAFSGCVNLDAFIIDPDNAYFSTQNGMLLSKDGTKLISASSARGFATVPNGVVDIGDWAFDECASLVSVTFPPSVTHLGMRLSEECYKLSAFIFTGDAPTVDRQAYTGGSGNGFATYVREDSTGWIAPGETGLPERWPDSFGAPILYLDHVYIRTQVVNGVTWVYGIKNGTALIGGPDGAVNKNTFGDLVIPSAFGRCPVVEVADGAFESCVNVTSVQIPETVARIGTSAFRGCDSLTSVTVPEGVTNIGERAFAECSSLRRVVLPSSVARIDDYAFASDPALGQMCLVCENPSAADTIYADSTAVTNYVKMSTNWGDGTGRIINSAWPYDSPDARPMNMSNGGSYDVTFSLGEHGSRSGGGALVQTVDFFGAAAAPTVSVGSGWRFTSWDVPFDCVMNNMTVTAQYEKIPYDAGDYTAVTNGYEWAFTVTDSGAVITGVLPEPQGYVAIPLALGGCTNVEISASLFAGCSLLTEVVVPAYSGETRIGEAAFGDCVNLQTITISGRVPVVGDGAFRGCRSLTMVKFSDGRAPVAVGTGIFQGTPVNLVIDVGHSGWSFSGWMREGESTLPEKWPNGDADARTIIKEYYSSHECGQMVDGLEWRFYISGWGDSDYFKLTVGHPEGSYTAVTTPPVGDLVIPSELACRPVTEISDWAFQNGELLTSITIPASVNYIGRSPFSSCGILESVIFAGDAPPVDYSLFDDTPPELVVYVKPGTTGWIAEGETGIPALWPTGEYYDTSSARAIQYLPGVYTQTVDGVEWAFAVENNRATVTSVTPSPTGTLEIPNDLGGCFVAALGEDVFADCTGLTRVTIPTNVTAIGAGAFAGCGITQLRFPSSVTNVGANAFVGLASGRVYVDSSEEIERVQNLLTAGGATVSGLRFVVGEFPPPDGTYTETVDGIEWKFTIKDGEALLRYRRYEGLEEEPVIDNLTAGDIVIPSVLGGCPVVEIGGSAFEGCNLITSLSIPASVSFIAGTPFYYCEALTRVQVDPANANYSSNEGCLLNKDGTRLLACPQGKMGVVAIPEGATDIEIGAFCECRLLTAVTIPAGVTNIGAEAFRYCSSLSAIEIPDSVVSMGMNAFDSCGMLESVKLSASLANIGQGTFCGCSSLKDLTIPEGVMSIGFMAFDGCTSLRSVVLPKNLKEVGEQAFCRCASLESVVIPEGVTNVSLNAFVSCSSLEKIIVPASVTQIGIGSFRECTSLSAVYIQGDAPSVPTNFLGRSLLYSASLNVTTYVVAGTKGWNGNPESTVIPSAWPFGDEDARPIVAVPAELTVTFDLGEHGTRTGGGELVQTVAAFGAAVEPEFAVDDGWIFTGWSASKVLECVVASTNVVAQYALSAAVEIGGRAFNPDAMPTPPEAGDEDENDTGVRNVTKVYDGKATNVTVAVTTPTSGATVKFRADGAAEWTDAAEFAGFADAGTNKVWYLVKAEGYAAVSNYAWVVIAPRPVEVEIAGHKSSAAYTGYPHYVTDYEVQFTDELYAEDWIAFAGTCAIEKTEVGHYDMGLKEADFSNTNANFEVAFSVTDGWLEITGGVVQPASPDEAPVDEPWVGARDVDKIYDGLGTNIEVCCGNLMPTGIETVVRYSADRETWYDWADLQFTNIGSYVVYFAFSAPNYLSVTNSAMLTIAPFSDGVHSQTVDGVTWTYTIKNGEASVGGGSNANPAVGVSTSGALTIPSMLGGCPVTSVGMQAFANCSKLTAIVVPAGVRTINAFAFNYCSSLESVSLPEGLEYLGYVNVFCGCSSLQSIVIPSTVTTLADLTFQGCTSLKSVTIPAGVTTLGDGVFAGCTSLEEIRLDGNTNYTIRAGLLCSKDGKTVLQCPSGFSSVDIPDDVVHLGDFSFDGCENLQELSLPESLESIGYGTIANCPIGTLHIPANVSSIDSYQFCGCDLMTNFTVDVNNQYFSAVNGLLYDKKGTMIVHCPRGLAEVTVASQTESVRPWAFEYCNGSMTVYVEKGDVDRIRGLIESSGFGTERMTFKEFDLAKPDGAYTETVDGVEFNFVVLGGKASLGGGSNKKTAVPTTTGGTVEVPARLGGCPVTALGRSAFDGCYGVTEVVLPEGLVEVGSTAFRGCVSLQQALLPSSVTTIGTGAFTGCTELRELTLPDGLVTIGNYAFSYCKILVAVTVPATVTSIGMSAFEGCTAIDSVRFKGNVPSGLAMSCLLNDATRVFYPRAYESAYAAIVPAEKFAGYSDANGLMMMSVASAGQPIQVDDAWVSETLGKRFGKGKVAEFKERFGRDFAASLFKSTGKIAADGRMMTVLDDYIAGTDPTDKDSKFQVKIEVGADGKPKVTWTPDLNADAGTNVRTYRVMGVKNLGGRWTEIPAGRENDFNFFRVEVAMPNN